MTFYPGSLQDRKELVEGTANDAWHDEVQKLCAYALEIEQRCSLMGTALRGVQRETRDHEGRCTLTAETDCLVEAAIFGTPRDG